MRGPDTPIDGRRRASQISMPAQASARADIPHDDGPRRFSLANWSVSTRLAALCAMASVLGLVFGGLRIADAVGTSDAYSHTVQLAVVGSKVTALAQAMEDERDRFTGSMALTMLQAAPRPTGAGTQVQATITGDLNQQNAELSSAESTTDAAATSAQTAVESIGSGFPASIQSKAANVVTQIQYLPELRASVPDRAAGPRSSTTTRACSPSFSPSITRSPPAAATSPSGTTCAPSARCRRPRTRPRSSARSSTARSSTAR